MCFIVDEKYSSPLIADKDIVCYKIICIIKDNIQPYEEDVYKLESKYKRFKYHINTLYPKIKLHVRNNLSYKNRKSPDYNGFTISPEIEEGYHSYKERLPTDMMLGMNFLGDV